MKTNTEITIITKAQIFEVAEEVNNFLEDENEAEDLIFLLQGLKITTKDFNVFKIKKSSLKIRNTIIKNAETLLIGTII